MIQKLIGYDYERIILEVESYGFGCAYILWYVCVVGLLCLLLLQSLSTNAS